MNFNLKKAKWLVPALALLVILESVLIVDRLDKQGITIKDKLPSIKKVAENQEPVIVSLQGDQDLNVDEDGEVKVILTALEELMLDGIDVYLKFNPDRIEVIGVDPTDKFSFVARNWIEPEKNRVLVSLVETKSPNGVQFEAGSQTALSVVKFKGKVPGKTKLEVYSSEDGQGTVLAGGGKEFKFSKKDLILNVE